MHFFQNKTVRIYFKKIKKTSYFAMMSYTERDIEKKYYTIGEISDQLGVAPSLIRFWETEFEALKPRKNKKGIRQFSKEDVETLQMIYYLVKEKGYTLQGANEILRKNKNKVAETRDLISSLQKVKKFLAEVRNNLP